VGSRDRARIQLDLEPSAQLVLGSNAFIDVVDVDPDLGLEIAQLLVLSRGDRLDMPSQPPEQVVERDLVVKIAAQFALQLGGDRHRGAV
jgi:hypothetical protein